MPKTRGFLKPAQWLFLLFLRWVGLFWVLSNPDPKQCIPPCPRINNFFKSCSANAKGIYIFLFQRWLGLLLGYEILLLLPTAKVSSIVNCDVICCLVCWCGEQRSPGEESENLSPANAFRNRKLYIFFCFTAGSVYC